MKSNRARYFLAASTFALASSALASQARAQETTTYRYDALGRLVATNTSGSVNDGLATSVGYDAAGNRSSYAVSLGGSTPTPTPTPTPTNQSPVANSDSIEAPPCVFVSVDVIANDTDPDGHYPLSLTAVDEPWAWIESSTTVGVQTPTASGTYTVTYTVADAQGAASSGSLFVTVTGSEIELCS